MLQLVRQIPYFLKKKVPFNDVPWIYFLVALIVLSVNSIWLVLTFLLKEFDDVDFQSFH